MQLPKAVEALSALGHASRLAVFRLLVRAGTEGMPAGEIACEVGVLSNTLSTHLTILTHANLIQSRKDGRSVIYAGTGELLAFLVADCCAGRPEITNDILESPPRGEVGLQAERAQTVPLR
jgi:ArsR family transcriptional regulator, arsenate/arsenite/antimonite-responsive transcriptional repressor